MKNERIAASFDKVTLPADREDALLCRILHAADAERAVSEREKHMNTQRKIHHIQERNGAVAASERSAAQRQTRVKRRALRVLVPVAAMLLVLAALFCIPSVAKAISGWFNDFFRVQRYMEGRNETEVNPDIERAVQTVGPEAQTYEITLLPDIPATEHYSYEDIDKLRVEAGQPAFSEADWAWLREMKPRVDELLYDGKNLIVRLFYETDPVPFTRGYLTGIQAGELACDILCFNCTLSVNGEKKPVGGYAHGLDFSKWYDKRDEPGFSVEDVRSDGGVYAEVIIDFPDSPGLPDGVCEAEFVMSVQDAQVDDMGIGGVVALVTHRFRFDTTAGNAQVESRALDACAFSGEAVVTVQHYGNLLENPDENAERRTYDMRGNRIELDGEQWLENRLLSFDGFSVTPVINVRSTGVHVTLPYQCPESWDYDTETAVMGSLVYELIVDGVSQGELLSQGNTEAPTLEISLTPTELKQVKSIVLRPYVNRISLWEGTPMVTGVRMDLSAGPTEAELENTQGSTEVEFEKTLLPGCDIVVTLPAE